MPKFFRFVLFMGLWALFSTTTLAASIERNANCLVANKGKWIVINYWATWCGYCRGEVPELNSFYRAHRGKVAMFGVNYDGDGGEIGTQFPTLSYNPMPNLHISGLPTTVVINPEGRYWVLQGSQSRRHLERVLGL